MKLVRHYLESISGIEIYPIISFIIFFLFFIAVTWYVFKMDKTYVEKISNSVLDHDGESNNGSQTIG